MRARIAVSPTLVLVITLLVLALLEWMNVSGASSPGPVQDVPRQVPFAQPVSPPQHASARQVSGSLAPIRPASAPLSVLLADRTYLPALAYPLRLLSLTG